MCGLKIHGLFKVLALFFMKYKKLICIYVTNLNVSFTYRYLVYMIGREATQCRLSFGSFLHFFLCIQVQLIYSVFLTFLEQFKKGLK